MEQDTPRKLASEMVDAFNNHDAGRMASLFAEDGAFQDVPWGPAAVGREKIRESLENEFAAFPDANLVLDSLKVGSGFAIAEVTFTGTFSGHGHRFPPVSQGRCIVVPGVMTFDIAQGKLSSAKFYHDTATEMRQLGMLPQQPGWVLGNP